MWTHLPVKGWSLQRACTHKAVYSTPVQHHPDPALSLASTQAIAGTRLSAGKLCIAGREDTGLGGSLALLPALQRVLCCWGLSTRLPAEVSVKSSKALWMTNEPRVNKITKSLRFLPPVFPTCLGFIHHYHIDLLLPPVFFSSKHSSTAPKVVFSKMQMWLCVFPSCRRLPGPSGLSSGSLAWLQWGDHIIVLSKLITTERRWGEGIYDARPAGVVENVPSTWGHMSPRA